MEPTNRSGLRYRDYRDEYDDQDFGHCDRCGLECLLDELKHIQLNDEILCVCPICDGQDQD